MIDSRLILVKCITLLYRESLLTEKAENSADLVRTILETIKLPEMNLSINHDRDRLITLKETALYLCNDTGEEGIDKEGLLQRLKVNCGDDSKLYEAFLQGIDKDMDEGSLKRTILSIRKFINDTFREDEIIKIVKEASTNVLFNRDKIKNMRNFVSDLRTKLEPYEIEASRKDPAIITSVDLGDDSSLNKAFDDVKSINEDGGKLITGWTAMNEMLDGGFRRHEFWIAPVALQHKYKTGFTLSLFKQIALYNKPVVSNKKPCLVRISFEDDLSTNLQFLYSNLVFNETGELPDIKMVSSGTMAAYVKEKLGANGWHIKMLRVNPSEWTYKDLQNYILELEANGYEVYMCMVDYVGMLPTTGAEEGPMGHSYKDMVKRLRNFFSNRKILFISPWQLSTEAKQLIRDGHTDFLKKIVSLGYFQSCRSLDTEPDGIFYIHIEKFNKRAYLNVQKDKHRINTPVSEEKTNFYLPFPLRGPIPDDFGKPRTDTRKLGGAPVDSGGEEIPFFEFTA